MVKSITYIFVLVICTSTLFVGCSLGMREASPKSPNEDTNLKNGIAYKTVQEAWGDVSIRQKLYDQDGCVCYDISNEGDMIYGVTHPLEMEQEMKLQLQYDPNSITLLVSNIYTDIETKLVTVDAPIQIGGACINSEWEVWEESKSYDGMSVEAVKIYAYERKTQKKKLIYQDASSKRGESIHEPKLHLKENKLLFDIVSDAEQKDRYIITSREYDLTTGKFTDIASQFAAPLFADDGYIGLGETKESKTLGYSMVYQLKDGVRKPLLKSGAYIYDLVTDGVSTAVVAQRFSTNSPETEPVKRNLWLLENGKEIPIKEFSDSDPTGGCGWPSMSKRLIIWSDGSEAFAYDRNSKTIVSFSNGIGCYFAWLTTNKYLIWSSPSKQDIQENAGHSSIINIIELKDLPIQP